MKGYVKYNGKWVKAPKGIDTTAFRYNKKLSNAQLRIISSMPKAGKGAKIAARFRLKLRK